LTGLPVPGFLNGRFGPVRNTGFEIKSDGVDSRRKRPDNFNLAFKNFVNGAGYIFIQMYPAFLTDFRASKVRNQCYFAQVSFDFIWLCWSDPKSPLTTPKAPKATAKCIRPN
jgi:hypothetical protein